MFVKNILSAWSIILINGFLLFDYREKYSFSSAWSEMMIDGSQVAALRVVEMMLIPMITVIMMMTMMKMMMMVTMTMMAMTTMIDDIDDS